MKQREIKFRAWDKEKKRMLFGIERDFTERISLSSGGYDEYTREFSDFLDNENYILQQYTGLKDKNSKEIYEGDIIVIPKMYPYFDYPEGINRNLNDTDGKIIGKSIPNYRGTVEWIYSQWQVVLNCVNAKKRGFSDGINVGLNDNGIEDGKKSEWEIIGNIYENSELLT